MRGTRAKRRRLYPLLAGSWAAFALLSGGCIDEPKREKTPGAAGMAGLTGMGGRIGGAGGLPGGPAGAGLEEAGASGAAIDVGGRGGEGGVRAEAGDGPGGDTGSPLAGSGGEAGEIDTFAEPCPISALDGWASVAGLGFDPANQPTALEVSVSNATDLANYAASPDPYIIHITGTIALPVLDVKSNKTIVGDDANATLEGGIRIAGSSTAAVDMVSNVVIRNLRINAASSLTTDPPGIDADGISIAYAHHVYIDHVDILDTPGDSIDITNGSDYVSVSWSKFRFVNTSRGTGVRIGHSDGNAVEDAGRLKVTLHHDWWTDSLDQRMPRVRFGDVHVFDNYFSHTGEGVNSYAIAAALDSRLLVENNYFDQVQNPHVFFSFDSSTNMAAFSEPTAQMVATGNTYVGRSDDAAGKQSGQGSAFTPPYSVALEPAETLLKQFVRHCSGPLTRTPVGNQ